MGKLFSHQQGAPLSNMVTIIGPSGSGKSTIADAFGFIADCLDRGVEEACDMNNRGGFRQLVSQGSDGVIRFELYYRETDDAKPITYELSIALDENNRPYVMDERLSQRVGKTGWPQSFLNLHEGVGYAFEGTDGWQDEDGTVTGQGRKVDVKLADRRKLAVSTYGAMAQYDRIVDFMHFLRSWYLCYFTPDAARQMQFAAPQEHLNTTGSNLNNVAQYMYRDNPKAFAQILKEIQTKLPGIEKIEPKNMENGQMVLKFLEKGFDEPFYSQHMSDGTLKLFAYYLLLHEQSPRQLVFIEEPENGLYHQYLTELAREMRSNVGNGFSKQLFVTTHSPFFVNALAPEDVWVLSKGEDGFSGIKRAADYDMDLEISERQFREGQGRDAWRALADVRDTYGLGRCDYDLLVRQVKELQDAEPFYVALMANMAALLWEALPDINWAGFYVRRGRESDLVLGPFQGKMACIRIPLSKGVCGTAAAEDRIVRVEDVHAFPGHIACDSASQSEIVLPIHQNGEVAAVLDIDSPSLARFSAEDEAGLAKMVRQLEAAIVF